MYVQEARLVLSSIGPATVNDYLQSLPVDRQDAIGSVREAILDNLPAGFVKVMYSGMIYYVVPLARFRQTSNGYPLQIVALVSQKNYLGDKKTENWIGTEYAKSGKKPDRGKSRVRFKRFDAQPLDLVGKVVARVSVDDFVGIYEKSRLNACG